MTTESYGAAKSIHINIIMIPIPNIPGDRSIADKSNETTPIIITLTVIEVFGDIQLPQLMEHVFATATL